MPAFLSGGLVPAKMRGKTLDGIVAVWDYYATFLAMAGVAAADPSPSAPAPIDSVDQSQYWAGEVATAPRSSIVLDHLLF